MMIVITFFIFLCNHFNGFNNVAYVGMGIVKVLTVLLLLSILLIGPVL